MTVFYQGRSLWLFSIDEVPRTLQRPIQFKSIIFLGSYEMLLNFFFFFFFFFNVAKCCVTDLLSH